MIFFTIIAIALSHFAHAKTVNSPMPKIGYGSSTSVISAKTQESFFMGFELGFEKVLGAKRARSLLVVKQVADGTPLGAVRSAETLLDQGAIALVGFTGSHDSLLVAEVAQKRGMFALFTGSGHSDLAKKGNTVFTTGASMQSGIEVVLSFVERTYPNKRGLAIVNPYAVFSMNHEDILRDLNERHVFPKAHIETARLTKELVLKDDTLQALKRGEYDYLFLTPYPDELLTFFNQLSENKIDLPMLAGSSWGTAESETMRRFLVKNNSPFYMAAEWVKGQKESRVFEALVKRKYGKEAISEISFGYDVGVITALTTERVKGALTQASLLAAFQNDPCFTGLTVGRICFDSKGGHAKRKINMLKFTKHGFVPTHSGE